MSNRQPTEESFLKDVEKHKMTVLLDNGVYRHLRFSSGSFNMQFDIVTYPWHLVYSGDMGTYVFNRLDDMFKFFRTDREPGRLGINLSYWGEKLEAVERHHGYRQYDPQAVREQVEEHVKDWIVENEISKEEETALREALKEEINYDDGKDEAYRTISSFSYSVGKDAYWRQSTRDIVNSNEPNYKKLVFQDIFEWNWDEYTYRYIWCCYAISWAIQQYDAMKTEAAA